VLALYAVLTQAAGAWALALPAAGVASSAAEAAAVGTALVLPWALRPPWHRRHLLLGGLLGLGLVAALAVRPWVVATMAMWTVAFSLFLPGALHAAALASVAATTWALLEGSPAARRTGLGLLLVGLAGLRLDFTYAALLTLAGTLVLMTAIVRWPDADGLAGPLGD
jgi:hypothetical protein